MIEYLENHFRYWTMNSWNRSSSYAANVKLQRIMPNDLDGYDFLQTEEAFRDGKDIIREFEKRHHYEWQIWSKGQQGGYLVLYKGGQKPSGYKRYCVNCGQQNYLRNVPAKPNDLTDAEWECYHYVLHNHHWVLDVYPAQPEITKLGLSEERVKEVVARAKEDVRKNGDVGANKCGRCTAERSLRNYTKTHMQVFTNNDGIDDECPDFGSWDIETLKWRVDIVWDFDKTIEKVKAAFSNFVRSHKVIERQIMVPKTIHVAVSIGGGDEDTD